VKNQRLGPPYWTTLLQPSAACITGQERNQPKSVQGSGCGGHMDLAQTMAEWELQLCVAIVKGRTVCIGDRAMTVYIHV
jgi:hypothetical protein